MNPAYKIVPYALAGCAVIALVTALASLIGAVVGWRGPHRKRRLWRFACCLAAVPVLAGLNYVYVYKVFLPAMARQSELRRKERSTASSRIQTGERVPAFAITDSDGNMLSPEHLQNKVVLVNFFATWCGPCIAELPRIQVIWDEHRQNPDFALIVIGREETQEAVVAFRQEHGFTFPIAADQDRSVYALFAKELIPRNYLIAPDGTICFATTGNVESELDELTREVRRQLEAAK
jgi:peroxiredoxin